MSSYHIDQSGRVVKLAPNNIGCRGCLYHGDTFCRGRNKRPLDAGGNYIPCFKCIFVEVVHE